MNARIYTVQTSHGVLEYYFDPECDGAVRMVNARTIDRYKALKNEHPNASEYNVFFAFTDEQFEKNYLDLVHRGVIQNGDKLIEAGGGTYGTREGLDSFFAFYDKRRERMAKECDPQEVYFYEYSNYECQIGFDGDAPAVAEVAHVFGQDVANSLHRVGWQAVEPPKADTDEQMAETVHAMFVNDDPQTVEYLREQSKLRKQSRPKQ